MSQGLEDSNTPKRVPRPGTDRPERLLVWGVIFLLLVFVRIGMQVDTYYGNSGLTHFYPIAGLVIAVVGVVVQIVIHLDSRRTPPAEGVASPIPGPAHDASDLVEAYLKHQCDSAQTLNLRDIFEFPSLLPPHTHVHLADIYVPLKVREKAREGVNEERLLNSHLGHEGAVPLFETLRNGMGKSPQGLRVVLLGEPGTGKSSAVGDLIHRFPRGAGGARMVLRFDLRRLGEAPADPTEEAGRAGGRVSTRPFWRALRADLCECDATPLRRPGSARGQSRRR